MVAALVLAAAIAAAADAVISCFEPVDMCLSRARALPELQWLRAVDRFALGAGITLNLEI
jgi:hypothetical protein